jgi:prepilin-type N-terminal cleavage/methylation domain-containing protein
MKKKKKQMQKGFTLIETIITMSLFLVILSGVYMMIQHYGDVSKTEHSRMTMQQESRYMASVFADEMKESGSVLTLAHTADYLGPELPFFNGYYPLNSSSGPDGIILATGDPEAVTRLSAPFGAGETVLNVEDTTVSAYDASFPYENPEWTAGQKGIVLGTTGYLVFEVASVNTSSNTITIRSTPVYYSGLLNTGSYIDDAQGNAAGNTIEYPGDPEFELANAPVIRLTNFSIYVFREVNHPYLTEGSTPQKVRQLIRITDAYGEADPLAENSNAEISVISENIWDMQISYIAYPVFDETVDRHTTVDPAHHYFAGGSTSSDFSALMDDIRNRYLKQMDVTIMAIADELGGKGDRINTGNIPQIGDNASPSLPNRKLGYRMFSFSVEPKNFRVDY